METFLSFLKTLPQQTWKAFNTILGSQWKDWESSYKAGQVFALLWNLGALILDSNFAKGLRLRNERLINHILRVLKRDRGKNFFHRL